MLLAISLFTTSRQSPIIDKDYCCRKTAVCNGDQLLDFSVPELVRSQSTFSTDPEVLQNCAGFTLCSSAGLAVGDCTAVLGLTSCMLCVQIYCVLCVLDYCPREKRPEAFRSGARVSSASVHGVVTYFLQICSQKVILRRKN